MIIDEYTSDAINNDYYVHDRQLAYGRPPGKTTLSNPHRRPKYRDANYMP